jgi:P27 family predicted phage terminase small subunit
MRKNFNSGPLIDRTPPPPGPPKSLGPAGRDLWNRVQNEYCVRDAGGLEMLAQACSAADRAAECAKKIQSEGLTVVNGSGGLRDHPLVKHELAARAFVTKTVKALGLNFEPLRGVGRPPEKVPVPYGIQVEGDGDEWEQENAN